LAFPLVYAFLTMWTLRISFISIGLTARAEHLLENSSIHNVRTLCLSSFEFIAFIPFIFSYFFIHSVHVHSNIAIYTFYLFFFIFIFILLLSPSFLFLLFLCKDFFLFSIILWFFVMLSVSLTLFTYRSLSFFCSLLPCGSVALCSSSCWVFRQQHKSLLTYFSPSIMLLVTTLDSFFWFSYFIYFPLLFFLLFGMNFIFDP
jgi:hypothetical protein